MLESSERIVILAFPDGTLMGTWADWLRRNPARYREAKRLTTYKPRKGQSRDHLFRIVGRWALRMGYVS